MKKKINGENGKLNKNGKWKTSKMVRKRGKMIKKKER